MQYPGVLQGSTDGHSPIIFLGVMLLGLMLLLQILHGCIQDLHACFGVATMLTLLSTFAS